jgi:predicted transcriptional regulator YdeE
MIYAILSSLLLFAGLNNEQTQREPSMKHATVVHRPSMMLIGITCRTQNSPEAAPHDIPKLWGRFYQENIIGRIPNKASSEIIAIYADYEGNYTKPYTCFVGCPVTSLDEVPEGMTTKLIPEGSYALYHATGEQPKAVIDTWEKIWDGNIERIRKYTCDYEVYGDKFFNGTPQEVEVYVAIDVID